MSRIGLKPIELPAQVTLDKQGNLVLVKGPKGTVSVMLPEEIGIKVTGARLDVIVVLTRKNTKSLHGLVRSLLSNAVIGVTTGWQRSLELVGVGYRAVGGGSELTLSVGFSHPVKVTAPKEITFTVKESTKVLIEGIDKKLVGETAAQLRAIRPPEPYKGKGIRYTGEVVRKKAGKAVKAAAA
jgi:large subunit ribosomal protein L6